MSIKNKIYRKSKSQISHYKEFYFVLRNAELCKLTDELCFMNRKLLAFRISSGDSKSLIFSQRSHEKLLNLFNRWWKKKHTYFLYSLEIWKFWRNLSMFSQFLYPKIKQTWCYASNCSKWGLVWENKNVILSEHIYICTLLDIWTIKG